LQNVVIIIIIIIIIVVVVVVVVVVFYYYSLCSILHNAYMLLVRRPAWDLAWKKLCFNSC